MSEIKQNASPIPHVRRVITGHDKKGKSIIVKDEVQPPKYWDSTSVNPIYDIYRTESVPASIDSEITGGSFIDEIALNPGLISPMGSVFRSNEFAPGTVTPFHRTESLDYGIVAKGSIVLELDDGKRVTLNEGDVLCQRGTAHLWRNEGSEWARVYFVGLGAKPIVIDEKTLKEEWHIPLK